MVQKSIRSNYKSLFDRIKLKRVQIKERFLVKIQPANQKINLSISFYFFLFVAFFLLAISCGTKSGGIEPREAEFFDSLFLKSGYYSFSSVPAFGIDSNPINAQQKRALIYWYNEKYSRGLIDEIFGDNYKPSRAQTSTAILNIEFDPSQKGIYNAGELSKELKENWGGVCRILPDSIKQKFKSKNIVLRMWMKIESISPGAILNIDIGKISEDILPNGRLDTEDKNNNEILDAGEDTGIDGISDLLEPNYQNGDDSNNDNAGTFGKINGLENNGINNGGNKLPDTEDLNHNSILDSANDYFSYKLPLEKNKILSGNIVETGNNGWMLIKIPVDLPDYKIGSPDKNKIETLRFWFSNAEKPAHIKIAQIEFNSI